MNYKVNIGKVEGIKKATYAALNVFTTIKSYCDLLRCKNRYKNEKTK